MADIHKYSIKEGKWTTMKEVQLIFREKDNSIYIYTCFMFQTLPAARSVALCAEMLGRLVLVGGELEPSARGHAGAGNFSSQTAVFSYRAGGLKEVGRGEGPPARGWADGAVWRGDRLVVAGGLTGDDTSPVRLADVWLGKKDQQ